MIYLLEDDINIQKMVLFSLGDNNMEAMGFTAPHSFWNALEKRLPDLIILDIMLSEEDGFTILNKLRKNEHTSRIPVVMLTAREDEKDLVSALNDGADDYITKPFSLLSLIARINAILRRCQNKSRMQQDILSSGSIVLDREKHTVLVNAKPVFLTLKEFDLLASLLENRGKVVTRKSLKENLWKMDTSVESRTVDVHIRSLRRKLGENASTIETIRGIGYKIL